MYLRPHFEETRIEVLHGLIRAHPLATFVAVTRSEIVVNHMPFLIAPDGGEYGTLRGHIPRDNPVWRKFTQDTRAVAVFHGPQCYISPSWYPSKRAHGKVVPTWNYAVAHARGRPQIIEDADWLRSHLNELTDKHESGQAVPWKVSDAPADFVDRMIGNLVGIEMPIASIVGKWKVSQNRPLEDRLAVADALRSRGDEASLAMAALVTRDVDEPRGDGTS